MLSYLLWVSQYWTLPLVVSRGGGQSMMWRKYVNRGKVPPYIYESLSDPRIKTLADLTLFLSKELNKEWVRVGCLPLYEVRLFILYTFLQTYYGSVSVVHSLWIFSRGGGQPMM